MRTPAALLLAALVPACGHRGDPLPPLRRIPPTPQEFRLAQRGDALEVRATAPAASVDGVAYAGLTVEFLYAEGQEDLEKAGRRHDAPAIPGGRVVKTLPLPAPGTTVRAAARGVAGREKGQRTLTLALVAQAPLEAPSDLTAVLAEDGVALSWHGVRPKEVPPAAVGPKPATPPGAAGRPPAPGPAQPSPGASLPGAPTPPAATAPPAVPPAPAATREASAPATVKAGAETPAATEPASAGGPRRHGFFVYRRLGSAAYDAPLVEEPVDERRLSDTLVPQGETACYVVRAVASNEPLIESAPSNEACVEVRDVTAPATPAGLAVLPREGGLEILWSPSAEPDLAGYRVYRTSPGGPPQKIADLEPSHASWLDTTAERGVGYRYAVTAFDQAGNESPPTEPVEASLP